MRKIIIIPAFASSHLLKCSLPNWIEVLEPDVIIINEGLFPEGPENKGHIDENFKAKYCFNSTMLGFDIKETESLIKEVHLKYPHTIVWLQKNGYASDDANKCFLNSISRIDITEFNTGDILLPLEPDVLFHENDKQKIEEELSRLTLGDGIQVVWKDFLETQFYTEFINEINPKWRRFAYCFDNIENYKNAMNAFMTQNYKSLRKVDSWIAYHYPWFVYDKWKELRYALIYRSDPQYWKDFEAGLREIAHKSKFLVMPELRRDSSIDKILIRPSRQDEARWAKFIDISHPKHIKSHPNFVQ